MGKELGKLRHGGDWPFCPLVIGCQDWHLHLDSQSPRGGRGLAALMCILSPPSDSSLGGWVLQGGAGPTASGCLGARSFLVAKTSAARAGRSRVGLSRPLQRELGWGYWW